MPNSKTTLIIGKKYPFIKFHTIISIYRFVNKNKDPDIFLTSSNLREKKTRSLHLSDISLHFDDLGQLPSDADSTH